MRLRSEPPPTRRWGARRPSWVCQLRNPTWRNRGLARCEAVSRFGAASAPLGFFSFLVGDDPHERVERRTAYAKATVPLLGRRALTLTGSRASAVDDIGRGSFLAWGFTHQTDFRSCLSLQTFSWTRLWLGVIECSLSGVFVRRPCGPQTQSTITRLKWRSLSAITAVLRLGVEPSQTEESIIIGTIGRRRSTSLRFL